MSIPTFQEMWSSYLFNSKNAPKGDALIDESLIRNNELEVNDKGEYYQTKEDPTNPIEISATDFMADGKPGGFVNGATFGVINNFFEPIKVEIVTGTGVSAKKITKTLTTEYLKESGIGKTDADGTMTFTLKEILSLNEKVQGYSGDTPTKEKSISQRQFSPKNETAYDFAKRVQLFETTSFQLGTAEGKGNYDVC